MSNGTPKAPGLIFPSQTFAKLTPRPFLHAHLKQPSPVRPNGRIPGEFRRPTINTGSLTHSNGSAVVRVGDTSIVCGVRAELLLVSDIAQLPEEDASEDDLVEDLGLLVPNLELSTGCSPAHLPGSAPGTLAQSTSYRILSLLHNSNVVNPSDLKIQYVEPSIDGDLPDEEPKTVTKAYWVLYIDILCLALDGNVFDAAWGAVMAALRNTVLPKAWWDPDREAVVCSPLRSEARNLQLTKLPIASTFAVFSTHSPLQKSDGPNSWVLADPDDFEEDVCQEALTVVLSSGDDQNQALLRHEKSGGFVIGQSQVKSCIDVSRLNCQEWLKALS